MIKASVIVLKPSLIRPLMNSAREREDLKSREALLTWTTYALRPLTTSSSSWFVPSSSLFPRRRFNVCSSRHSKHDRSTQRSPSRRKQHSEATRIDLGMTLIEAFIYWLLKRPNWDPQRPPKFYGASIKSTKPIKGLQRPNRGFH